MHCGVEVTESSTNKQHHLSHPRDCHATRRCVGAQDLLLGHKLYSALMYRPAQRLPLLRRLGVLPGSPRQRQSQCCQTPVGTRTILTHAPCPPLPVRVCTVFRGDVCPPLLLHALTQWVPVGWGTSTVTVTLPLQATSCPVLRHW
jgi:hypothetical protein